MSDTAASAFPGFGLCNRCTRGAIVCDDTDEFFEEVDDEGVLALHHANEEGNKSVRFRSAIRWEDTAPDFPAMLASAEGRGNESGCRLCGFVHQALVRRQVDYHGRVTVKASYVWGGNRDAYLNSFCEDGLVCMRCEVFGARPPALAYVIFGVEVADGESVRCCNLHSDADGSIDRLSEWLGSDGRREAEPLAPDNVGWIRSMLDDWDEDPEAQSVQGFVPSRLVYVGADEQTDPPRLVLTEGLADPLPQYAALSYCWGPEHDAARQLTTTTATLGSHLQRLPRDSLTPVLHDTLVVCRALSIPFIWIDAVCIVQDDAADWSRESEVMGYIYYHSYLTICPLASSTCLQGFLGPRPAGIDIPFQSRRHAEIAGCITLVEYYNDKDIPSQQTTRRARPGFDLDSPLWMDRALSRWETRGWTFQEDYLSSRSLYFGRNVVHIACPKSSMSETGFLELGTGVAGPMKGLFDIAVNTAGPIALSGKRPASTCPPDMDAFVAGGPAETAIFIWGMLSAISRREFTKAQDFLPAIAGMAKAYNQIHNDVYLAGLWERCLHLQLLWAMPQPPSGTLESTLESLQRDGTAGRPYISPSWSWARVALERHFEFLVSSHYTVPGTEENTEKQFIQVGYGLSHLRREFALLSHRVDLNEPSQYGSIRHASLRIRGRMLSLPAATLHPNIDGRPPLAYFADRLGTLELDWQTDTETSLSSPSLRLLFTTSCCQATSNEILRFIANPAEDHDSGLADRLIRQDGERPGTTVKETTICLSCRDEDQPRNAMGLVIHPAGSPDTYFRVGVFVFFGHTGGIRMFDGAPENEIELV